MKRSTKSYNGRVEYRAVQDDVEQMLAEGYRIRHIYAELSQAGKLTISYSTFCDYVKGKGERSHSGKKAVTRHKPVMRPVSGPLERKGFRHEKVPNIDDLGPPPKVK